MSSLACYFHTVKYLKFKQIYYRFWNRYKPIRICSSNEIILRHPEQNFIPAIIKPRQIYYQVAHFLNKSVSITPAGIWNDPQLEKLWLYNLHYFDELQAIADPEHIVFLQQLLQRWVEENPPFNGCGWDPYPLSLRIVNWIKWHLRGNSLSAMTKTSLALQMQVLSQKIEWHLLGNHVFANAKACLFAGLFFQTPESCRWRQQGLDILTQQLDEQILKDGGHFERSPMYHAIILEDLLDLINLYQTYQQSIPESWLNAVTRMLTWLQIMVHPDQQLSFFNDSSLNVAATLANIQAYARELAIAVPEPVNLAVSHLADSGFCRLQNSTAVLLADVGAMTPNYLPGHAHAGTLSFELSLDGHRIFINSGTSTYEQCAERLRQRGSAAHNTAVINGNNSSQVWAAFRVGRRAKIKNLAIQVNPQTLQLTASHSGYHHLPQKIIHQRIWQLQEQHCLIEDHFHGHGQAEALAYYHLHPNYLFLIDNAEKIQIIDKKSNQVIATLMTKNSYEIIASTYHPEFGITIANQCLRLGGLFTLPTNLKLMISWV